MSLLAKGFGLLGLGEQPETDLVKAKEKIPEAKGTVRDPLKIFNNGYAQGGEFERRPSRLSYKILRSMAYRTPLVKAIVLTRVNQVASFAKKPNDEYDIGFVVRPRDRTQKITPALAKLIDEVNRWVLYCGPNSRERIIVGDTFQSFTRKVIRDSLIFDQLNFQVTFNRNGTPSEMIAMPAATLRLLATDDAPKNPYEFFHEDETLTFRNPSAKEESYCQVIDNKVVARFTPNELAWGVRNPVSDVDHFGYGWSELEDLVHHITSVLWAEEYNRRFFSQGSNIKGILNLRGSVPQRALDEFRREWHALISGVTNSWRTPIVNAEDIQWVGMHQSNRDMEYSQWMDYLIKITCAHYSIAPEEIGFSYGNQGQTSQVFQNNQEQKLKASKDKGLRPLLTLYQELLTKHVVMAFDPDLELVFTGLDRDDESTRLNKAKEKASVFMTVDEVRDEFGLDPLPDGKGDVILSAIYQQHAQVAEANAQQDDAGEEQSEQAPFGDLDFESLFGEENDAEAGADVEEEEATADEGEPEDLKRSMSGDTVTYTYVYDGD